MGKDASKGEDRQLYPLNSTQTGLLMSQIFSLESLSARHELNMINAYFIVRQDCDYEALEKAYNRVRMQHDALRTRMVRKGFKVYQYIEPYTYNQLERVRIEDSQQAIDDYLQTVHQHHIKTFNCDLTWAQIAQTGTGGVLLMRFHHYCLDGYGLAIILRALERYYDCYASGEEPGEEKAYSVTKHFELDQKYLQSSQLEKDDAFWKNAFHSQRNYRFPAGHRARSTKSDCIRLTISGDRYEQLKVFCQVNSCTLQSVIMSLAAILTYIETGADNFSLTAVSHNRTTMYLKQTVGNLFTSYQTFFDIDTSMTVNEFVRSSHMSILKHMSHGRFPIDRINKYIYKESIKGFFNFCHQWIVFSGMEFGELKQSLKYDAGVIPMGHTGSQFYCAILEDDESLTLGLTYQVKKFTPEQVQRLLDHFVRLLDIVLDDPYATIEDVRQRFLSA